MELALNRLLSDGHHVIPPASPAMQIQLTEWIEEAKVQCPSIADLAARLLLRAPQDRLTAINAMAKFGQLGTHIPNGPRTQRKYVLIFGSTGTGKSTLINQILFHARGKQCGYKLYARWVYFDLI